MVGQREPYLEKAESYAAQALAIDPQSAKGHCLSGLIHVVRLRPTDAAASFERAIAIDPHDAESVTWAAGMLAMVGQMPRARRYAQISQSIDPLNPIGHLMVGFVHVCGAEFGEAVEHFERWHRADPTIPMLRLWYALALVYARRQEDALVVLREGGEETSQNVFTMIGLALRHALTGRRQDALDAMNDALRAHARADQVYSWMLAGCYALLDRRQEALEWLEHAARGGFINYPFLRDDLLFHSLHSHEAFERLMEEIEGRWESFAT